MRSIGRKVQTKLRKKLEFNKHTGFNNRAGWIFFPKKINVQYPISISWNQKTISAHCVFIQDCRNVEYSIAFQIRVGYYQNNFTT